MSKAQTPPQAINPIVDAILGVVGLVVAYVLGSRALDTGSWWQYLGTLVMVIISVRLFVRAIKRK